LRQDLAQHPKTCTLAYFHKPLFSSGKAHGGDPLMKPLWLALYRAHADIVINGHDHDYERFAPQDPEGNLDPNHGIREFVVGSGGKNSHRVMAAAEPNSEARNADTFGVLKLTLHSTTYDWVFVPEAGKSFTDSGTGRCH
jgi:acid phosphatase type 7